LGGISLILFIFTESALKFITSPEAWSDFANAGLTDDYVNVTRILLLTPILFAIQTVFGIFLTIKKSFLIYSLAGVIYNLGMIIGLLIGDESNYYYTAWGMVFGSLTAITVYFFEAKRNGFKGLSYLLLSFVDDLKIHKENLLKTWSFFLPRIMMLNGVVIANVLIKNIADGAGGQITAFDIGLSIQNVFFAVITSISAVFFPDLAKSFVDESNRKEFWKKLRRYAEYTAGISLVGSILTFIFAPLVMWAFTIFGEGQDSAEYIVYIARIASLSFVFLSVNEIINKYFYVKEKVWSPVIISSIGVISQIITTYFLDQNGYDAGLSVGLGMLANGLTAFSIAFLVIRKDMKEEIGSNKKQKITDFGDSYMFDKDTKESYPKNRKSEERSLVKKDIHFKLPIKKMGRKK
jgi:peptidoglycan biosynthesis protein MviN/MurJ (putative lipid II flippase)